MDFADLVIRPAPAAQGVHEQIAMPCNTGRMPAFTMFTSNEFSDAEVLSLYESVGWAAYTRDPELLTRAIRSSSFVATPLPRRHFGSSGNVESFPVGPGQAFPALSVDR